MPSSEPATRLLVLGWTIASRLASTRIEVRVHASACRQRTPRSREQLAATIHEAGLTISAGAVNTAGQGRRMIELGAEILVSDRLHELREELAGD